ncbi:MAG: hypothetical protein M3Q07_17185 [Pseudobdellovibrionaceae bacterium]|nr:hypothetical protein [Pseudobdellovibrionaceae bacterium]
MEAAQKTNTHTSGGIHSADFWIKKGFTIWEATQLSRESTSKKRASPDKKNSVTSRVHPRPRHVQIADVTHFQTYEYKNHSAFSHFQPSAVASSTHALEWTRCSKAVVSFNPFAQRIKIVEPTKKEGLCWLMFFPSGVGFLICTSALIFFGAQAGSFTTEAWFWSALLIISSTTLISLPLPDDWRSNWFGPISYKALGLFTLAVGYCTMGANLSSKAESNVVAAIARSTEVTVLEKQITDLESRIAPTRKAVEAMDAVKYRTLIARMQRETEPLEDELKSARNRLVVAKKSASFMAETNAISDWNLVEWLRRLALEPLNIVSLHGFLRTMRKRRSVPFAHSWV